MSQSQQTIGENRDIELLVPVDVSEVDDCAINSHDENPKCADPAPPRRAEVDVIIIFLTYGIYLFHLCLIYTAADWYRLQYPNISSLVGTVSENPFTFVSVGHIFNLFISFMDAWNMPMFFYLSGQNVYSALFRRSETRFRHERMHRLLVPTLFLFVVTQFPLNLGYFAPRATPLLQSYSEYARGFYRFFIPHQAWFLLYLFMYAQMFTHWFRAFHPVHNTSESIALSYCGSTARCCTIKPFNFLTKVFCCLNFIFKPASTPDQFISSVTWFLGGPIRLTLIPGILIGLVQTVHNLIPYYDIMPSALAWFLQSFPFFPYMVVYVIGYATAAADKHIRQDSRLWSWTCFIVGAVLCTAIGPIDLVLFGIPRNIVKGFMRGIGQWLYVIGSIALARTKLLKTRNWHKKFRMLAMPFYLIHQQVLVPIAAGALRVPYLRTFPVMLIITSITCITLSYIITRSGSLRYFFGLPPPKDSSLPGRQLRVFGPALVLIVLAAIQIFLSNLL